jgi:hypothetical protein
LKRLLDTSDRNGSTSGPTQWQIYDDDDQSFSIANFNLDSTVRQGFWNTCRYVQDLTFVVKALTVVNTWYSLYGVLGLVLSEDGFSKFSIEFSFTKQLA